jgi:hypothetical protein
MLMWPITLRAPAGVIGTIDTGESQFVIGVKEGQQSGGVTGEQTSADVEGCLVYGLQTEWETVRLGVGSRGAPSTLAANFSTRADPQGGR